MDVSAILDPLNDAQRQAVAAPIGNILILAGAGSGKTRVLVHRIAWFVQTGQASPQGILAVTFTNKAAAEMRGRTEHLLGMPVGGMWVGTFHGIAHRLLRAHWREAGLPQQFQILDSEDQLRTIKRVLRNMNLDEGQWAPREIQWFIGARKEEGLRASAINDQGDPTYRQMIEIYLAYERTCEQSGMVDFAELLLRAHELWRRDPELLAHYRQRFRHILIDEFQDTNAIQYAWIRALVGDQGTLFAVGDDDQSIYSWRGARVENMRQFEKDYPNAQVLRLEQNYRSTATILSAANALIANNPGRFGKELWTEGEEGSPIELYAAFNEIDEARFVVGKIASDYQGGQAYASNAVLYRVSAQSRVFEEALRREGIPYRVHGGFRFYERAEIKDALAYLRLVAHRADDTAFERIVNTPTRGIGGRSLEAIRYVARTERVSLWQAMLRIIEHQELSARALNALSGFVRLIERMNMEVASRSLEEMLAGIIELSGLPAHYQKTGAERAYDRIENLEELVTAAKQFEMSDEDREQGLEPLAAFLAQAALEAGEHQVDAHEDGVQLMTLHSAKGLEFPKVYLVGVEEGLFPHQRSSEDPAQLEEERRLCYVGMTRAQRHLVVSHAEARRMHGSDFYPRRSRFIHEIPKEFRTEVRMGGAISSPRGVNDVDEASNDDDFVLGQRVLHAKFGEGVVLNLEGQGSHARVQVNFERAGAKWLVAAYAGLESL